MADYLFDTLSAFIGSNTTSTSASDTPTPTEGNTDRVVVVTGADLPMARHVAEVLQETGFMVVACAKSAAALKPLERKVCATVVCPHLDEDVAPLYDAVSTLVHDESTSHRLAGIHPKLWGVVNVAPTCECTKLDWCSPNAFATEYKDNVLAIMQVCHAFLPLLKCFGESRIINIYATPENMVTTDMTGVTGFLTSMGALDTFTKALGKEFEPWGVRVTSLDGGQPYLHDVMHGMHNKVLRTYWSAPAIQRGGYLELEVMRTHHELRLALDTPALAEAQHRQHQHDNATHRGMPAPDQLLRVESQESDALGLDMDHQYHNHDHPQQAHPLSKYHDMVATVYHVLQEVQLAERYTCPSTAFNHVQNRLRRFISTDALIPAQRTQRQEVATVLHKALRPTEVRVRAWHEGGKVGARAPTMYNSAMHAAKPMRYMVSPPSGYTVNTMTANRADSGPSPNTTPADAEEASPESCSTVSSPFLDIDDERVDGARDEGEETTRFNDRTAGHNTNMDEQPIVHHDTSFILAKPKTVPMECAKRSPDTFHAVSCVASP